MSRLSGVHPTHEELYSNVSALLEASSEETHLQAHRARFAARGRDEQLVESEHTQYGAHMHNPLAMSVERETKEDYFNRLELKFLELQAKQSFLHRITGDECPSVEPGENERLEQHNDRKVAAIKALMAEDAAMSAKVLALSKQNAADHAQLASQTAEMARLLAETRSMELELARLKTVYPPEDRMTIDQAFDRIDKQEAEIQRLTSEGMVMDAQTEALRATNAVQAKRVLALARDRETAEAKAAAARRAREAGSEGTKVRDLMEWQEATLRTYRDMLGIRSARAISADELLFEYDVAGVTAALTLLLENGVLRDAKLVYDGPGVTDAQLNEVVENAVDANDAPGLIADVLVRLRAF